MSLIPTIVNWYGGKQKLARQIISMMPSHEHYVEVFMGGGSVFFQKSKSPRNTINDYNSNLVNLFIQVRDNFDEFAHKVYWTLYSRQEYKKFYKLHKENYPKISDIDRALMYFYLVRSSFNGMIHTGFSASVESSSNTFTKGVLASVKLANEKLQGVVIENRSFHEIIPKYDRGSSLLYLDPPYWVTMIEKKYYEKTLSLMQHVHLRDLLAKCESPWLLSYDNVPEVVELYKNFTIMKISANYSLYKQSGKGDSRKIDELIISNIPLADIRKPQLNMFDESGVKIDEMEKKEVDEILEKIEIDKKKETPSLMSIVEKSNANKRNVTTESGQAELF